MKIKKLTALASVIPMLAVSAPVTSNCVSETSPEFWFAAASESGAECSNTIVYINRKKLPNDVYIDMAVFYRDGETYTAGDSTHIAFLRAAWDCESEYVKLDEVRKPDLTYQKAPFDALSSEMAAVSPTAETNYSAISYSLMTQPSATFKVTGTETISYPLGYTGATISENAPYGRHTIFFCDRAYSEAQGQTGMCANVFLRYGKNEDDEFFPTGSQLKNLNILVSDRMFGDVNDDSSVDSSDAAQILSDYAQKAVTKSSAFSTEQLTAADVNVDDSADASDAAMLLSYYAYSQANKDGKSLLKFVSYKPE